MTKPELIEAAKQAAKKVNLDEVKFVNQIEVESGFNPEAKNKYSGATGIAQIIPKWHPNVDPTDPIASLNYAASLMASHLYSAQVLGKKNPYWYALASYNWGPGNVYGYTKDDGTIVPPWDGRLETLPAETRNYINLIMGPLLIMQERYYGKDVPDEITKQKNDWTCSIRSLYSALYAMWQEGEIDFKPTYGDDGPYDVYKMMVPAYVNSSVGLLDGSLGGIQKVLERLGIPSTTYQNVTLQHAQSIAGTRPAIIDGHNWFMTGHLAYLRGIDDEGLLVLENPANNAWQGVTDKIRDSWSKPSFAPWSMLVIDKPEKTQQKTPTVELDKDSLRNLVGNAYHTDGVIVPALLAAINNPDYGSKELRREMRNIVNWILDQNLT